MIEYMIVNFPIINDITFPILMNVLNVFYSITSGV